MEILKSDFCLGNGFKITVFLVPGDGEWMIVSEGSDSNRSFGKRIESGMDAKKLVELRDWLNGVLPFIT